MGVASFVPFKGISHLFVIDSTVVSPVVCDYVHLVRNSEALPTSYRALNLLASAQLKLK